MKSDVRILNDYRVIYLPTHKRAMTNSNWEGYVYEHVVVAEEFMGRPLQDNEVVHHLNGNRGDNRKTNLLVIDRGQHARLHAWIDAGAPGIERFRKNRVNSEKAYDEEPTFCKVCQRTLQDQISYCSDDCSRLGSRKVSRPTKAKLEAEMKTTSLLQLGKKYGVSDNAVRKWAKQYNLIKPTLSQASGPPEEGAETSGEVKSS